MAHILIVNTRFYPDIADMLLQGARDELRKLNHTFEEVDVPGALEITPAIRFALETKKFDGFVALGCVMRGETTHYDTVCEESARGITWLGVEFKAAIGNGILTVEDEGQAIVRADPRQGNKGADAARAAVTLIALRDRFGF